MCATQPAHIADMRAIVSSPHAQPQPIDDIADMRAIPWGNSAPRAVQVVFRHGALGLMPLALRTLPESSGTTVQPPVLRSKRSKV